MKKSIWCLMTALLSLSFIPAQSSTRPDSVSAPMSVPMPVESAKIDSLLRRVTEIKEIDRSALSLSEKKELRKELRSIKKQLRENNRGVYLSLGAIIIIILLLILIL